jgi:hypothetical protein
MYAIGADVPSLERFMLYKEQLETEFRLFRYFHHTKPSFPNQISFITHIYHSTFMLTCHKIAQDEQFRLDVSANVVGYVGEVYIVLSKNGVCTSSVPIQHSILGRISPVLQKGCVEILSSSSVEIPLQYCI